MPANNRLVPAIAGACFASAIIAAGCAGKRSDHIYGGPDRELEIRYAADWKASGDHGGDAEVGMKLFWGRDEAMKLPCAACHSFDAGDTMTMDGDGRIRAGTSLFAARHRPNIIELSNRYVRDGARVFVPYWHDGPTKKADTEQMSHIDAYLASRGGDADHPTATTIDYSKPRYPIPAAVSGGDPVRGAELAQKYCDTCHEVDGKAPVFDLKVPKLKGGVVPFDKLDRLAARIRNKDGTNNRLMPGFPKSRMSEQDLRDVLAHFEQK
jgi:mono/diheme cytochrome c family protein